MREKLKSLAERLNTNILTYGKGLMISAFKVSSSLLIPLRNTSMTLQGEAPYLNNRLLPINLTPSRLSAHPRLIPLLCISFRGDLVIIKYKLFSDSFRISHTLITRYTSFYYELYRPKNYDFKSSISSF